MSKLDEAVQELELEGAEWSNLDDLPDEAYDLDRECADLGGEYGQ